MGELIKLEPGQHESGRFSQQTAALGLAMDVTDVADALEQLDRFGAELDQCVGLETHRESK